MNSKRSYLDTLNSGRQRRSYASLDQLNRSLETLEQRVERDRGSYAEGRPHHHQYQSIARDIERVRGQEDGVAAFNKLAGELNGLREELRQQMTLGVRREFESLRTDMERAYASGTAKATGKLGAEFERLSGAIQTLAEKSDDRSVNLLRLDIEQLKKALDTVAREETVRSVDRRWDDFDRRLNDFENRVSADVRGNVGDPGLQTLNQRLEQINDAVGALPESLQLQSLEEKVRTLASALDHFISSQGGRETETLAQIDVRLDEISRALAATAASVAAPVQHTDMLPFERIEARIAALAQQIEEVSGQRSDDAVIDRLDMISQRVEHIAARSSLPEQAIERLASQMAAISDRIERTPEAGEIFSGIEQRFDVLSNIMEQRQNDVLEQGNVLFRELERRLDEVADRIDHGVAAPDTREVFAGIEQRFEVLANLIERQQGDVLEQGNILFRELERRLDEVADKIAERNTDAALDSNGLMHAIDARFSALNQRFDSQRPDPRADSVLRGLEARLDDISQQIDQSAIRLAGIDPKLINNLEAQVAGLSAHLSRPNSPLPEFDDIGPRLADIERSIAGNRENLLEAARRAAEDAARSLSGSHSETAAVAGLAQDLKSLETLTRRSDERNSKTFEAIHDTLLKIVDRMGSLAGEAPPAAAPSEAPRKMTLRDAPSIDAGSAIPGQAARVSVERSPAQAAAAAAVAALDGNDQPAETERGSRVRSMIGGLTRKLGARKDPAPVADASQASVEESAAPVVEAVPSVDLDAPLDPKVANRPLEPGSSAPDLSAIMKRVRDERALPSKHSETDAAKSDFIAAARRAAQAAAAEAEILKRKSDIGGPVKALRLGDLLKARRKPILMAAAAIMIALAGLQLGKAFMNDGSQATALDVPAAEQTMDAAALGGTAIDAEPAGDSIASDEAPSGETAPPVRTVGAVEQTPPENAQAGVNMARAQDATTMPAAAEAIPAMPSAPEAVAAVPAPQAEPTVAAAPLDIPAEAGPLPLREAAAGGDAKALFEVASRYAQGRGMKADMAQAAKFYEKAAELGLAPAEYRIGNFYEKGLGVGRDVAKARDWYLAAAEKGNASAMHNLAVLYAMGAEGAADNEAAAKWFIAAAERGVKDSQFNLGILAAKGVGMPQSLEESYKWFALVAKAGDKDAAAKRDEIANSLRPEQLERARALAELWRAKPIDTEANAVEIPDSWQESAQDKTAGIDMKKAVQNIQLILNKNGYDAGSPDGIMGGKTKTAIAAFQKDNGMKATGAVDEKLVAELLKRK